VKLSSYLRREHIVTGLSASTKSEAITQLVRTVYEREPSAAAGISADELIREVMLREEQQSTGLGDGLAFPHARIAGFQGFFMAVGVSREGVSFDSLDKKPAHIITMLISSNEKPYLILQAMGALAKFLNTAENRQRILDASPEEIWKMIDQTNIDITHKLQARDIMRPVLASVREGMTIHEAARIMHLNHLTTVPVVDENNNFKGFVCTDDIFRFGIPDFFSKLKTVSFIRHLDPFEKYFSSQDLVKVDEISHYGGVIDRDATLLEIVFQMAVKGYSKLFVLNNGKLEGIIDSYRLIDKVIFM